MAISGRIADMLLVMKIAAGIVLGLGLWQIPTILRRRKLRSFYLCLSSAEAAEEALRPVYTKSQTALLMQLAFAKSDNQKQELASQLANSFPDR